MRGFAWVVIVGIGAGCGGSKPPARPLTAEEKPRCEALRSFLDPGPETYKEAETKPVVGMTKCEWSMEAETLRTDTVICTGPPDPSYESFLDACLPDLNDFPDAVFAHVWLGRQRDLEIKLGDQDGKLFLVIKSTPGDEYWEKETTTAKEAAKDNALFSGMFDEYPSHYVAWRGKPEGDAWISTHCVEGLECMVGTGSDGVSGRFEMELFLGPASDADPVFADAETAIVSSLAEAGMTDSVERDATSTRHQWTVPAEHDPKWDGFTMTLTKYQLEDTFTDAAGATQHYWAVELWSGHE